MKIKRFARPTKLCIFPFREDTRLCRIWEGDSKKSEISTLTNGRKGL